MGTLHQQLHLETILPHLVPPKHIAFILFVIYTILYNKYMHGFHALLVVSELPEIKY